MGKRMGGIAPGAYRSAALHPGRQNQNLGGRDPHRSWIGVELSIYLQVRQRVVVLTKCRKPPVASRMDLWRRERRDYDAARLVFETYHRGQISCRKADSR